MANPMHYAWYDLLGMIGVVIVLWAYYSLQTGRWHAEELRHSLVNAIGALLIAISLLFAFNLSAFVVEVAWVLISAIGVVRWWRARASRAPPA